MLIFSPTIVNIFLNTGAINMNICFEYLYRDAGNFKNWGVVIFSNKNNSDARYLEQQAIKVLIDREFFVAYKADVPNLHFKEYVESLDHDWHEFHSFKPSTDRPNDSCSRDIVEFIESLKYASKI